MGNARLRNLFGLSSIRVSQWLREFREYQTSWTQWNSITRSCHATADFYRYNVGEDSGLLAKYISLVGLPSTIEPNGQPIVVAAFPDITTPDPRIFAVLSSASRLGRVVEITYRSMRAPKPYQRIISPHSIVRAGRRWHVRAYCELNKQFRDYTLGRIMNATLLDQPSESTLADDKDWMTEVPVRLIAHPDMSPEQEAVIRFEYFKNTSSRVTTCRGPLVSYFVQDVRAATDVKIQRPPEYQLAVGNIKEIQSWLFPS